MSPLRTKHVSVERDSILLIVNINLVVNIGPIKVSQKWPFSGLKNSFRVREQFLQSYAKIVPIMKSHSKIA